jgi:hypothetical protein
MKERPAVFISFFCKTGLLQKATLLDSSLFAPISSNQKLIMCIIFSVAPALLVT